MAMTENIVHKKYRILTDAINDIYDRISWWRKSTDIALPSGVALDTKLNSMNTTINQNLANMGTIQNTTVATQNYVKGNTLVLNNQLYRVKAAIASGGTIVTSGSTANVETISVSTLSSMLSASNGYFFYFDYKNGKPGFYTDSSKTTYIQIA